jgi:hypothetical protein
VVGGQSRIVRAAEVVFYPESRIHLGHKTDFYQKTPFADSTLQSLLLKPPHPEVPKRLAAGLDSFCLAIHWFIAQHWL